MAIKISGTTVINDSRNITDVENFGNSDTVYTGSGANLTGIQAGSSSFTASGSVTNGRAVLLNSNGTVSVPTKSVRSTPFLGDETNIVDLNSGYVRGVFDSNANKVVIVNRDGGSGPGDALVATVSGTDITFGSNVEWSSGNGVSSFQPIFDSSNNKVVIVYNDSSDSFKLKAIVGTVSGDSISFGSIATVFNGQVYRYGVTFDSNSNKVVVAFEDYSGSAGKGIVGTVSGTSISFGSATTFNSSSTHYIAATFDTNSNKVVICYNDDGNSDYGTAIVGTVSGTGISFGSETVFNSSNTGYTKATFDSNSNKVVIVYSDIGDSYDGEAVVGTVSGTSISFGSSVDFQTSGNVESTDCVFDSAANRIIVTYEDNGNGGAGAVIIGTVSGTSISFGTKTIFDPENQGNYPHPIFLNNRGLLVYYDDNDFAKARVIDNIETDVTSGNFIGIAAAAISNGASGSVTIVGGINASQSSLSVAEKYYVQADGTLDTEPGIPSIEAGISISATQINVGA